MQYRGLTLDPFQEQAISWLRDGRSVLVCAPTGTGKTIVADAVVEQALEQGRHVIYTAPVKALSNQKFRDYSRLHGTENVGLVTGDLVIRRDAPCLVMTTEILRNMLLAGEELDQLAAVILDEIHFLDDRERGTVWEEVLIYLPSRVKVLGLSATLSNVEEFADWLTHVRGDRVEVVQHDERAVPLDLLFANRELGIVDYPAFQEGYRRWKNKQQREGGRGNRGRRGRQRGPDGRPDRLPMTKHFQVFDMIYDAGITPALYFVVSRRQAESFARGLGRDVRESLLTHEQREQLEPLLRAAVEELGEGVLEPELQRLYRKGIGFHHAGLHVQLKALVEDLYERKLMCMLYTTSTFALGINMPARTVVLDQLTEFDGRAMEPLSVRRYMQKAGRAGRRGLDDHGTVLMRMDFQDLPRFEEHLQRYFKARPETVRSSFNLSFNSVVNLLHQHGREPTRALVEKSFLAFRQSRTLEEISGQADRLEARLKSDGVEVGERLPRKHQAVARLKELARLRKRQRLGGVKVWRDFERRRQFLVEIGYLQEDDQLLAGGKILQNIQIEEIFTTEVVLSGLLEDLQPHELFGLMCAMTNRLPKGVQLHTQRLPGDLRKVAMAADPIRWSEVVQAAEAITGTEVTWCPPVMAFGARWAMGDKLEDLQSLYTSETDFSGSLVSGFRRAKDMLGQLRVSMAEDEHMVKLLRDLIKKVSRDEVEVIA
jgi:superfamily II RNA helicase